MSLSEVTEKIKSCNRTIYRLFPGLKKTKTKTKQKQQNKTKQKTIKFLTVQIVLRAHNCKNEGKKGYITCKDRSSCV